MIRIRKNIPIVLIELYLTFTILLYIYGPWNFPKIDSQKLYFSIFIYQIMLFIGYKIGFKIKVAPNKNFYNEKKIIKVLKKILIIYFFITFLTCIRELGLSRISLIDFIEKITQGINNPALGYYSKFNVTNKNIYLGKIGTFILILGSPFSYIIPQLILIYFKKLTFFYKIISAGILVMNLLKYIALGTNKGIFDIIIIIISIILLKVGIRENKKTILKRLLLILTFILISLFSFNKILGSRSFGVNFNENTKLGNVISLREEYPLQKVIPLKLEKPLALLSGYLCQGYYGFSLSMEVENTPMLGIGQSLFLVDRISEYHDINKYTLQKKVEKKYGWDSRVQWFTMYSWIANDIGFIGVAVYMLLFGIFFSIIYKDALKNDNIIAKVYFPLLIIQFIFIPANSQLFVNMNSTFSTLFVSILWIISKIKKNRIR